MHSIKSTKYLMPSAGNIIFTVFMISVTFWVQSVGAINLIRPDNRLTAEMQMAQTTGNASCTIPYQGYLADTDNKPLDGPYDMTFRLYQRASGGNALWTEQWNGITVEDGLFNVTLGSVTNISRQIIMGNQTLYLGITIGFSAELTQRLEIPNTACSLQPLIPDENGNVAITGNLITNMNQHLGPLKSIHNVQDVYGRGESSIRTQIHMPGGVNKGNMYINWHSGRTLHYGGGKEQTQMSVDPDGNLWVAGELQAAGAKPAIVETESYGKRKMYAVEDAEVRFTDEGLGTLENGVARIDLDPMFLETIEGEYLVHVTPYGNASLYVAERAADHFVVKVREGDDNVQFSWRISAIRKGYGDVRMEAAE